MKMDDESLTLRIDEKSNIRFLSSRDVECMFALQKEVLMFMEKSKQYVDVVLQVLLSMEAAAETVNKEKLRAIGTRMLVENKYESEHQLTSSQKDKLVKKQDELEECKRMYHSLMQVLSTQEARMKHMRDIVHKD